MKFALFVPGLVAAIALSGSVAFAGTSTTMQSTKPAHKVAITPAPERCTALESQFDTEIKAHAAAKKASAAKTLRQKGGQLCASGKTSDGVKKLEQALNDIGVKPASVKN